MKRAKLIYRISWLKHELVRYRLQTGNRSNYERYRAWKKDTIEVRLQRERKRAYVCCTCCTLIWDCPLPAFHTTLLFTEYYNSTHFVWIPCYFDHTALINLKNIIPGCRASPLFWPVFFVTRHPPNKSIFSFSFHKSDAGVLLT